MGQSLRGVEMLHDGRWLTNAIDAWRHTLTSTDHVDVTCKADLPLSLEAHTA